MRGLIRSYQVDEGKPVMGEYLGSGGFDGEVLDLFADFLFVLGGNGVCLDMHVSQRNNPAAFKKILGRKIFDFLPLEVVQLFVDSFKRFLETKKNQVFEYTISDKDGVSYFEGTYAPFKAGKILLVVRDVSEKKKVGDSLEECEERFYTIFHSSPLVMAITCVEDGRYVEVSKGFEELTGWSRDEAVGRSSVELNVWADPENREKIISQLDGKGAVHRVDVDMRMKSGDIKSLLFSAEKICLRGREYLLTSAVDITDRKKSEGALRESEERYRNIFENAIEGIYQTTPEGRYMTVNPSFARMLGYGSPEDLISSVTNIGEQVYVNAEDRLRLKKELSDKGFVSGFEAEVVRKDGGKIWISINAHVVRDDVGNVLYYEGTNEDITKRKKAEEELKKYSERLESMVSERTRELESEKNRVQELLVARTQLINQLSHDLRTPLTPITALLPLIGGNISSEKDRQRFDIVLKNVEYMKRLLVDTLSMARLDSGSISMNKISFNLRKFVEEILLGYEVVFASANIRAENAVPEALMVSADDLRIREVFDNLINNSVKYSPNGGLVRVYTQETDGDVIISVSDEGIGVDKKDLGRLFLEFFKGDETRHNIESIGLGLAICRRIVEKHGGRIWAQSEGLGRGLTVSFTLPVEKKRL